MCVCDFFAETFESKLQPGVTAYTSNSIIWNSGGQPELHNEFPSNLDYTAKLSQYRVNIQKSKLQASNILARMFQNGGLPPSCHCHRCKYFLELLTVTFSGQQG